MIMAVDGELPPQIYHLAGQLEAITGMHWNARTALLKYGSGAEIAIPLQPK
jgi:hypothetical protein